MLIINRIKNRLSLYVSALNFVFGFAQEELPNFKAMPISTNIQSPNSASLGKFGDIPVSLYSGTANVAIPIFKLTENNIVLDISLNYDTSGVRVNSVPTWVGQNWNLQAGGVITRNVRGKTFDEFDATNGNNNFNSLVSLLYNNWDNYALTSNPTYGSGYFWNNWSQGYKNSSTVLNTSNWSSQQNLFNIFMSSVNNIYYFQDDGSGPFHNSTNAVELKKFQPDLEPDVFSFNFMGHVGKFFLGQDGEWKVSSSSNLKVICDFQQDLISPLTTPALTGTYLTGQVYTVHNTYTYPKIINKITLIDNDGNKFVFGYPDATELTFPNFFDQIQPIISSAWYLKYVKDKFDNIVYEFEYDKGPYIGHFYHQFNFLTIECRGLGYNYPSLGTYSDYTQGGYTGDPSIPKIVGSGQLISPVYLKKIKTKSGAIVNVNSSISNALKFKETDSPFFRPEKLYNNLEIDRDRNTYINSGESQIMFKDYFYRRLTNFTQLNPEWSSTSTDYFSLLKWKKLDNIDIRDFNDNLVSTINFDYVNEPTRRLFLKDVTINATQKYSFEYDNDNLLPNFMSCAVDHMGYYNGTAPTLPKNPFDSTFWGNYYNQRQTNADKVKYGSLKRIVYPTKGYTDFEYEAHRYSKEVDENGTLINSPNESIIGGLRIKKIIKNDGFGNNYVKEYKYTNGINSTTSSGNFLYKPIYYKNYLNLGTLDYRSINGTYLPKNGRIFDINQLIPMTNLFGNIIEYENVIEKESFFNSSTNVSQSGYNLYKFSNYSQFPDLQPINSLVPVINFKLPKTDKGYERGKVLEKYVYDNNNILKEKTTNTYQSNPNLLINAVARIVVNNGCNIASNYFIDPQNEKILGAYQICYSDKYLIEEKKEIFSESGSLISIAKFNYQGYPSLNTGITNNGDLFLKSTIQNSSEFYSKAYKTTYDYPFENSNTINNLLVNKRILSSLTETNELGTNLLDVFTSADVISKKSLTITSDNTTNNIPLPKSFIESKGNINSYPVVSYDIYDSNGNINQITNTNGISTAFVYGYNKTLLIAKIENATYADIQSQVANLQTLSNTGTEVNLIVALNTLRTNLPNAMVTTYTYKPLIGISTITDPKGNQTIYEYDAFNRLKQVKDHQGNVLSENEYHYKN